MQCMNYNLQHSHEAFINLSHHMIESPVSLYNAEVLWWEVEFTEILLNMDCEIHCCTITMNKKITWSVVIVYYRKKKIPSFYQQDNFLPFRMENVGKLTKGAQIRNKNSVFWQQMRWLTIYFRQKFQVSLLYFSSCFIANFYICTNVHVLPISWFEKYAIVLFYYVIVSCLTWRYFGLSWSYFRVGWF